MSAHETSGMVRFPISLSLLSMALAAFGCTFSRNATPGTATEAKAPSERAPSVIVETSASGDHGNALVPVWANDPRWGSWDAPVTIVEFGDLECPFTKAVAPTLEALKEHYGPRKLRLVWKHLPLDSHDSARSAADAAATVFGLGGNEAFWKFHARALEAQHDLDEQAFGVWAEAAGVRKDAYFEAKSAERFSGKVRDDLELATKLGAGTTPAFRINGLGLTGAQTVDSFRKVIDAELAKAEKLVAAGTRPADVYVTLTRQNGLEAQPKPVVARRAAADEIVWQVPVVADDPTLGPPDALVTVVEFSDFQCPFCERVLPTLSRLMDEHPGEVRLVWKDQPLEFHQRARPAAILGRIAYERGGNDAFWDAHEKLFVSSPKLEDDDLENIAQSLNIPWAPVAAAIRKNQSKKIDESIALAQDVEAHGTPHFFLNGVRLSGAQPFEKFEELFQRRREAAVALVASGVPRASVYAKTIEAGRTAPAPELARAEAPAPDKTTPARGAAGAPVVITVWSDFQCPFCKRVLDTVAKVEKEFAGRVKLVFRHNPLPFHKDAPLAAEAAQEAFAQRGAAGFWRYHDALFAEQSKPDGLARSNLEAIAKRQGLSLGRFRQALDARTWQAKVESDMTAAKQAGVTGTPSFVINGYVLSGAQPVGAFRKLVLRALEERRPPKPLTKIVP